MLYRDLGAIGWPKKGEMWQLSRKQNQLLTAFSSISPEKKVSKRRQSGPGGLRKRDLRERIRDGEGEKAGAGNKPGSVSGNHSSGIAVAGYL